MLFFLFTGCPLQGKAVDIPPSISVSTIGLGIAGCSRKGAGLLAHGVPISPTGTSANLPNTDVMGVLETASASGK